MYTNTHTRLHTTCTKTCLLQIVLLNMLIVMMREMYVKIRETERDVFLRGRAELIVEVETLMSKSQQERYSTMPPFLHLLSQVCVCVCCDGMNMRKRMCVRVSTSCPCMLVKVFCVASEV